MRQIHDTAGWLAIDSAPFDKELRLRVTDGDAGPFPLNFPCRRTPNGWVSSGKGTALVVAPVKWKPYQRPAAGRRMEQVNRKG